MTDDKTTKEPDTPPEQETDLDPLTAMRAELDGYKARLEASEKALADANKNTAIVLETNRRLIADRAVAAQPDQPKLEPGAEGMKAFYRYYGIKEQG
jgi:hypothetical protein